MDNKIATSVPKNFTTKYNLAQLYFAQEHGKSSDNVRRLTRRINSNPVLKEELKKANYVASQRYYSPRQLQLIYQFIEEPII